MNKEIKREWLTALRSGEYKQTRGLLHRYQGGFCCLGVLLDACFEGEWVHAPGDAWWCWNGHEEEQLPHLIREGCDIPKTEMKDLMSMNDDDGANFRTIADYIEANL